VAGVALGDAAHRFRLPQQWFLDLLAGTEADLHGAPIERFGDLERYCYCVASTIGLLVVRVRGMQGEAVESYARNLGIAVQLTNVLRDVGADARAGRVYLAREDLARKAVAPESLARREPSEELRLLLALYAERARIRYERAQALLPAELRRALRPAQAMGAIYRDLLETLHARLCAWAIVASQGAPALHRRARLAGEGRGMSELRGANSPSGAVRARRCQYAAARCSKVHLLHEALPISRSADRSVGGDAGPAPARAVLINGMTGGAPRQRDQPGARDSRASSASAWDWARSAPPQSSKRSTATGARRGARRAVGQRGRGAKAREVKRAGGGNSWTTSLARCACI
jgi:hypothetical protein